MKTARFLAAGAALLSLLPGAAGGAEREDGQDRVAVDPDYAVLRVGFAAADITPGPDVSLWGYAYRTNLPPGNAGVHDPLRVRALALRSYRRVAVLVSLDLAGLPTPLAREYRAMVAKSVPTGEDHVILSCTHAHSGPRLLTPELAEAWEVEYDTNRPPAEMVYTASLPGKILDAVRRAEALTYPASVWVREAPLGLAYNRRAMTGRGLKNCWEPQQFPHRQPGIPDDVTCSMLLFEQVGGPRRYLLWSLGAHPTVLGKTSRVVSADYPGLACGLIEEYVPGARSLFVMGASGETQPWIATQEDPRQVKTVARAAASFVALLSRAGRPVATAPPHFRCASETWLTGETEVDLTVWKIGSVWLMAVPTEMFASLSARLRRKLDGELVLATVSNGMAGYFPAETDYSAGGYEVAAALDDGIEKGAGEELVERLLALAARLGE